MTVKYNYTQYIREVLGVKYAEKLCKQCCQIGQFSEQLGYFYMNGLVK